MSDGRPITACEEKIRRLQISILKKIVLMDIAYRSYSLLCKVVLYGHYLLGAVLLLLLAIIRSISNDNIVGNLGIALTAVITALPKFREYLQYEPTRDKSKEQLAKYTELSDRIDATMKTVDNTNPAKLESYEVAASFEFRRLEIDDPDVSSSIMKKYDIYCAANNIPTDDIGTKIQLLLGTLMPMAATPPITASPMAAAPAPTSHIAIPAPTADDMKTPVDISVSERSFNDTTTPIGTLNRKTFRAYQRDIDNRDKAAWISERLKRFQK